MNLLSRITGTEAIAAEFGGQLQTIQQENTLLKAIIQRMEAQQSTIIAKLEDVLDHVASASTGIHEVKTTEYIGKKATFLPQAVEEVERLTMQEIRNLVRSAAKAHPTGTRKGYTTFYAKLKEITGVDVYTEGKVSIGKKDGLGFVAKDPSYINVIFKRGIHKEAAVIAKDILRTK